MKTLILLQDMTNISVKGEEMKWRKSKQEYFQKKRSKSAHSAMGLGPGDTQMQPINQSAAPAASCTSLEEPHWCNREIINSVQIVNCPFYTKENQEPLWLKSMSPDSKRKKNRFMTAQLKKTMSVPCEIENH